MSRDTVESRRYFMSVARDRRGGASGLGGNPSPAGQPTTRGGAGELSVPQAFSGTKEVIPPMADDLMLALDDLLGATCPHEDEEDEEEVETAQRALLW
jgi:hypothetical protein